MRQFYYGVRDRQGMRQTGVITAPSQGEAMARLRERFPLVLKLENVDSGRFAWFRSRVNDDDLLAFTHQLAAMLEAGLSFGKAMEVLLLDQVHRPPMRRVLVQIAAGVSEGRSFSQMLRLQGHAFPELYASMIEAGESSASVPEVLRRLADHLSRTSRLKMEVASALFYPAIVLVFGVAVSAAILAYGAPILEQMYHGTGLRLPLLTRLFLQLGGTLVQAGPLLLLLALLGLAVFPQLWRTPLFRDQLDYALLRFSPVRNLLLEASVARCCRTLATLYGSGVPILQALDMTARTAGNAVMRDTFAQVRERVAGGSNLAAPLFAAVHFPPMAAGMITAGEAAGSLPDMLERLADYYEVRLDFALKAFAKGAEPILIVAVGLLVGSIVLALGLPMMNLVTVLS